MSEECIKTIKATFDNHSTIAGKSAECISVESTYRCGVGCCRGNAALGRVLMQPALRLLTGIYSTLPPRSIYKAPLHTTKDRAPSTTNSLCTRTSPAICFIPIAYQPHLAFRYTPKLSGSGRRYGSPSTDALRPGAQPLDHELQRPVWRWQPHPEPAT